MDQMALKYSSQLQTLEKGRNPPSATIMLSSVTGERITDVESLSKAQYWVRNMVSPVNFLKAYEELPILAAASPKKKLGVKNVSLKVYDVLEIGPHPALQRYIKDTAERLSPRSELRYHSTLSRNISNIVSMKELAGRLNSLGYPINFDSVNGVQHSNLAKHKLLVELPEYPFNHSRSYWHESRGQRELKLRKHPELELLGIPISYGNLLECRWRKIFDSTRSTWIQDHKEVCRGMIQVEYQIESTEVDGGRVARDEQETFRLKYETSSRKCTEPMPREILYQCSSDVGVD
ncbi:hypothetical protein OCU04_011165 [Sclerotinia nivalis]|uniref:Uncharacterized protein n=1 Tax=Sclerotinia nivalis TaxID=352851 RepID=A0A9X0AAX8_9HELO|nr:hypothetical protein OCU04_011165 [Sclerotinia nivalis]